MCCPISAKSKIPMNSSGLCSPQVPGSRGKHQIVENKDYASSLHVFRTQGVRVLLFLLDACAELLKVGEGSEVLRRQGESFSTFLFGRSSTHPDALYTGLPVCWVCASQVCLLAFLGPHSEHAGIAGRRLHKGAMQID